MVATRSGRVNSGGPPEATLISDGLAEVKATRQRRGAGFKSVLKAAEVISPPAEQAEAEPEAVPIFDEPNLEVFKKESAVKMSPRRPSQPSTPASPASGREAERVTPATKEAGVRPRRLSMREVVTEAAELPLPSEEATPPPRVKKIPKQHTISMPTWLGATLCVLVTAVLALGSVYLLCNHPFSPRQQAAVQPLCAQASVSLARLTALHADLRSQAQTNWAEARTKAQSAYTQGIDRLQAQTSSAYAQGTGWLQAKRESVLSSQLGANLFSRYQELQLTIKGLLARSPPVTPLATILPADSLRELVLQAAGLPDVDDIYQHAVKAAKGTGVLMACGTVCSDVQGSLAAAVQQPHLNLCEVDGGNYTAPGAAGALQTQLATFLATSPAGVVVISGLDQMHVEALSVLSNTLSEGGGLQLQGRTVSGTRALYVVLVASDVALDGGAEQFESKVKAGVQQLMAALPSSGTHDAPTLALALRRRFDFVLPSAAAARASAAAAAAAEAMIVAEEEPLAALRLETEAGEEGLVGATEA